MMMMAAEKKNFAYEQIFAWITEEAYLAIASDFLKAWWAILADFEVFCMQNT